MSKTIPVYSALPSSSLGAWRGSPGITGPAFGGDGGQVAQGTSGLSVGTGSVSIGSTDWHPSVLYLLALVIGEMFVFHVIGRVLK